MAHLLRMLIIALLVGIVAGGAVWYLWGAMAQAMKQVAERRRLAKDAQALLGTAKDQKAPPK